MSGPARVHSRIGQTSRREWNVDGRICPLTHGAPIRAHDTVLLNLLGKDAVSADILGGEMPGEGGVVPRLKRCQEN